MGVGEDMEVGKVYDDDEIKALADRLVQSHFNAIFNKGNAPPSIGIMAPRDLANDKRNVERREPKPGVITRHDDGDYVPKRIKRGRK